MIHNILERQATKIGESHFLLKKRFEEAISVMCSDVKNIFKEGKLDFEEKKFYSSDGKHYLQWKIRDQPDKEISYRNQQTNRGIVTICSK